jgi:hypothetical protein
VVSNRNTIQETAFLILQGLKFVLAAQLETSMIAVPAGFWGKFFYRDRDIKPINSTEASIAGDGDERAVRFCSMSPCVLYSYIEGTANDSTAPNL